MTDWVGRINPKGNYFLDNRKPLSKPSQDCDG